MVFASSAIATPPTAPNMPALLPKSIAWYWAGFGTSMNAMVLSGSPCGLNCCEDTPAQPALRTARPAAAALEIFMLPLCCRGGDAACPAGGSASRLHQIVQSVPQSDTNVGIGELAGDEQMRM